MLQKEFEERIGRSVSEQEYVDANAMYMMAGDDMDKDVFCQEWKQISGSPLVNGLFNTAYRLNQSLQEQQLMVKECQGMLSDVADALIGQAEECIGAGVNMVAESLDRKAEWLLGRKALIFRKIKGGFTLSKADLEYISKYLK